MKTLKKILQAVVLGAGITAANFFGSTAYAQDEKPKIPIKLSADYWRVSTTGKVSATEHQTNTGRTLEGTLLDFKDDLDINPGSAIEISAEYEVSHNNSIIASFQYQKSGWKTTIADDIMFNEAFYPAGTGLDLELRHTRTTAGYERKLCLADNFDVFAGAGWALDRISLKINGNNRKKGEDFCDEIIPVLSARAHYRPFEWLEAAAAKYGINAFGIAFSEDTQFVNTEICALAKISDKLKIKAGYCYEWFKSSYKGKEHDRTRNTADNLWKSEQGIWMLGIEFKY